MTRSKLKLRSGSILDSRHTGELPIDSIVSVLEQIELDDGTKRVRVAKFGESTLSAGSAVMPRMGVVTWCPSTGPGFSASSDERRR